MCVCVCVMCHVCVCACSCLSVCVTMCVHVCSEFLKDKREMGAADGAEQSQVKLLADLKRAREGLLYSEDKVESLTEGLQARDKVRVLLKGSQPACHCLLALMRSDLY